MPMVSRKERNGSNRKLLRSNSKDGCLKWLPCRLTVAKSVEKRLVVTRQAVCINTSGIKARHSAGVDWLEWGLA